MELSELANVLKDRLEIRCSKNKDKLKVGTNYYDPTSFASWLRVKIWDLPQDLQDNFAPLLGSVSKIEDLFREILSSFKTPKLNMEAMEDLHFNAWDTSKYLLFQNLDRDKPREPDYFVYNTKTQRLSHIPWSNFAHTIPDKEIITQIQLNARASVKPVYDPFLEGLRLVSKSGETYYEITTYQDPDWKSHDPSLDIDPFLDFMEYLFPVESEREQIFYWIYHSITSRCQTFLYLTGAKGTGKSTLGEFLGKLVGHSNFHYTKGDFATSRFNGYMEKSQLILIEEFKCKNDSEKNTLKRIANSTIAVEGKGRDQKTVDNHCSFIMMNNDPTSVMIEPDDRRFSVPVMAKDELAKIKGEDFVNNLRELMENPSFISSIAHHILDTYSDGKYGVLNVVKGDQFEQCCWLSRGRAIQFIVEYFKDGDNTEQTYLGLRELFAKDNIAFNGAGRSTFPNPQTLEQFFTHFKIGGESFIEMVVDPDDHKNFILRRIKK